mmetsp:Transcript_103039/g.250276  ORF Transcript_103039/g.250276 Transcript_103039/m.250276 type:complete len:235 (-) Transcript_103039:831-1535(-)
MAAFLPPPVLYKALAVTARMGEHSRWSNNDLRLRARLLLPDASGTQARVLLVEKEGLQHDESSLWLVLRDHVARTTDGEEVEVVSVARDVAAHLGLAVPRPGSPGLGLRKTHRGRPVLRVEAVQARVCVAVVDEDPQVGTLRDSPVPGEQAGLSEVVDEAVAVISGEEVRILGYVQRLPHRGGVHPDREHCGAATRGPVHVEGLRGALRRPTARSCLARRTPPSPCLMPLSHMR